MNEAHEFLKALATVLCVAAVATVVFQRLHQPVILGYLLAGFIVGPHVPIPLVADQDTIQTLSELGVILLMFSLGLEFNLRRLAAVGPTAGFTAVVECSLMIWLGFTAGQLLGWTTMESIFAGAIVAISSTTIIVKAFDERGVGGRLRELVLSVLIVEDLFAILLLAALTALSTGSGLSAGALAVTVGRLAAFLAGVVAVGLLIVPRAVRAIVRLNRPETTLVASVGICFAVALLAQEFGYSVALGAFIAGSLVAESGEEKRIEHLIQPVRDMFVAIFFVSVGMLIDPALIARNWAAVVILTLVVLVGKISGVSLGAFLSGSSTRLALQSGMSLAQIGEFSFIIAALGLSLGATREFLYPVAVAVSALTTLSTPWLIRASAPVAKSLDRVLPAPLQTFTTLYASWVEDLRGAPVRETKGARVRRLVLVLLLDATLLAALVIGMSLASGRIAALVVETVGVSEQVARTLVVAGAVLLSLPFCIGIMRLARRLGTLLAEAALPAKQPGKVDLALAPRRVLIVTLQVLIVLLIGAPLVAITQPFLRGFPVALVLTAFLAVLAVAFWRSATNLQGHVQAGAQMIIQALGTQARGKSDAAEARSLDLVHQVLPGLGAPVPLRLDPDSPAVGRTLAELSLRGITGATVLAIIRGAEGVLTPRAGETLRAGDVLALAGTHEAVEAALELLAPAAETEISEQSPDRGVAETRPA